MKIALKDEAFLNIFKGHRMWKNQLIISQNYSCVKISEVLVNLMLYGPKNTISVRILRSSHD